MQGFFLWTEGLISTQGGMARVFTQGIDNEGEPCEISGLRDFSQSITPGTPVKTESGGQVAEIFEVYVTQIS